uniref:Uncharacterized protein n=1 Tax=Rhizophora mucronata TaxID=61149 RepID=A0A2P2NWG0_RHIMU
MSSSDHAMQRKKKGISSLVLNCCHLFKQEYATSLEGDSSESALITIRKK